jgi:hypothetical protein
VLCCCLFAAPLAAQTNLGRIVGTVRDTTGSVIPAAKVTVVNEGTNSSREFATLPTGDYEVANLVAGSYRVDVEIPGFKRFSRAGNALDAGRVIRVDATLELGQISEQVSVAAGAPVVETESPSVANRLDWEMQSKSPVATGGRPWEILVTMPLIHSGPGDFVYTVAGSRGAQTEFHVDGIASPAGGSPLGSSSMTMEGTSELRVQGVNNSAEYSQPGIFQQVSRSGTNQWHGSAFYYHTNSALNARSFFSPTKPVSKRHNMGGSIGGPLRLPKLYDGRNRTFFLLATEGSRTPGFNNSNATVPTPAMRGGDFSGFGRALTDPFGSAPFAQMRIPESRISAVSRRVQERFYPLPNFGDPNLFAALNHRVLFINSTQFNNVDLRLDQQIGSRNSLYGRFGWIQFNNRALEGNLPTIGQRTQLRNLRTGVISDTHVFRPSLINEFRLGFQRSRNPFHGPQRGIDVLNAVGIEGVGNVPDAYGIPVINVTGVQSLTQIQQAANIEQSKQLSDAVTWIRGRHTIKSGLDARLQDPNNVSVPIGTYGTYSFNGSYTGQGYADFLLGIPQQTAKTFPAPPSYRRQYEYGFFVNDDFRLGPRLTVQLGLRYEYQTPTYHKRAAQYNFDPASGQLVLVSEESRRHVSRLFNAAIPIRVADGSAFPRDSLWRPDRNNFAPRVGFAFRPSGSADFAVRGGYGVFYDRIGIGVAGTFDGGPFTPGSELFTNRISAGAALLQFPRPFPAATAGPSTAPPIVSSVITNLANPYVQQWNLSIDKSLAGIGVRTSYIGSKGTNLLYQRHINRPAPSATPFAQSRRPYPLYGDVALIDQGGSNNYHAFQVEANRRHASLTFNAGYTWSNLISDAGDSGGDVTDPIENPLSRAAERGRESYAIRHRLVGNVIWKVPVGRGQRFLSDAPGIVNQALGGWETMWTFTARSGRWFTPSFVGRDPSNTNALGGRPDRVADGNLAAGSRALNRWFDASAFALPPVNAARFGTAGRNILEGPGMGVVHLGLIKNFHVFEGLRANVEMAAKNLLNHPNFNDPNSNISSPLVGQVTGINSGLELGAGRVIQMRVRLVW